jgi:type I restriction enzyme R subunit
VVVFVVAERVQYYGPDGRLITESLKDYTRPAVRREFASLDDFLRRWSSADRKQAVLEELEAQGVLLEALADEVGKTARQVEPSNASDSTSSATSPSTARRSPAGSACEQIRSGTSSARYGEQAQRVRGSMDCSTSTPTPAFEDLENICILTLDPFNRLGTPHELVRAFGGKPAYLKAVHELEATTVRIKTMLNSFQIADALVARDFQSISSPSAPCQGAVFQRVRTPPGNFRSGR